MTWWDFVQNTHQYFQMLSGNADGRQRTSSWLYLLLCLTYTIRATSVKLGHWLWFSMGLCAFSAVEISSHDFLCHPRVDTKAVGQEVGQFDRVIPPLSVPSLQMDSYQHLKVVQSQWLRAAMTHFNRQFSTSSMFIVICVLDLLLNPYFYKSKPSSPYPKDSCFSTCLKAGSTTWLARNPHYSFINRSILLKCLK